MWKNYCTSAGVVEICTIYEEDIFNEIYVTGEWPNDFLDSVIIPIEKKHGGQGCADFRTIV